MISRRALINVSSTSIILPPPSSPISKNHNNLTHLYRVQPTGLILKLSPSSGNANNIKLCKNCEFFEREKCKLFVDIDIVTGDASYIDAKTVRYNDDLCGIEGRFYEKISVDLGQNA